MDFSNDFDVIDSFINETNENIDNIELVLLTIENSKKIKDLEMVHSIFRSAHSIKAGANLLNFIEIEKSAHKLENFLDTLRNNNETSVILDFSTILLEIDIIRDLIDQINL